MVGNGDGARQMDDEPFHDRRSEAQIVSVSVHGAVGRRDAAAVRPGGCPLDPRLALGLTGWELSALMKVVIRFVGLVDSRRPS